MRSICTLERLLIFVAAFVFSSSALAREILVTKESTVIYTGPGKYFRPLITVPKGTELPVGKKLIKGKKGGEFYKVLVILSNRKKAIGFMPNDAAAAPKGEVDTLSESDINESPEDLESFEDYELSKQSFQISYSHLKTRRYLATAGFVSFVGPGLYFKGCAGAFKTENAFSPIAGMEFGSDALIFNRWSGWIAAGVGVFINPKENELFTGSKNDLSNFLVQGGVGIRYTTKSLFSLSLGGTQAALFNVNNSTVTWGAIVTAEFPL